MIGMGSLYREVKAMKNYLRNFTLHPDDMSEEAILDKNSRGKYCMEYNLTVGDETLFYGQYRYPRTLDLKSI